VSKRGSRIPKKLKNDAILEAIFELRFETTTKSEFLVVKLAEHEPWRHFIQSRLPAYSFPEPVRQLDPNLRFLPIFELLEPTNQRSVRIGPNVLSYHLRSPYDRWGTFSEELAGTVKALFETAEAPLIDRLGLRYLNAFTPESHGINKFSELDIKVCVGGSSVDDGVNINVMSRLSEDTVCAVRVATPDFVLGSLPPTTSVLADIDVFTPEHVQMKNQADVMRWLEAARLTKNIEFFALLTDKTIDDLEEK